MMNCMREKMKRCNKRLLLRKKEEIRLSPMTKAPIPTEKSKKQRHNKNATTSIIHKD